MSTVQLKSICDLLENDQRNSARYRIPGYQRGYRWTKLQVTQLLDDIWEFFQNPQGPFYCLQPIVVQRTKNEYDFDIVDGQQRLTTIRILLTCLEKQLDALEKKPFEIGFETRGTESFLNNIESDRAEENIDYFYICEARSAINDWFEKRDSMQKLKFLQILLNVDEPNVRVIWFELPSSENPVNAFTRLNIGKIPLTNAELIRALFLKHSGLGSTEFEHEQINNIALEWDRIESALQDDEFWYFLNDDFFDIANRITFLFEMIVEHGRNRVQDRDPYSLFYAFESHLHGESGDILDQWKKIRQAFLTFQEWFADKRLYHMIGFLIHLGTSTKEILSWSQNVKKSEFDKYLVQEIYRKVFLKSLSIVDDDLREDLEEQIRNLEYSAYKRSKIFSILLLFNLVTLIGNSDSNSRFPFDQFKKEKWDIEHVRSIASVRLERYEERVEWLKHCLEYLKATNQEAELCDRIETFSKLSREEVSESIFEELYGELRGFFKEAGRTEEFDNSIANLTLLDQKTNRGYKNAVFAVKRTYILSLDEIGTFVPPCTRNIFLKYYSKNVQQVMFWSEEDESSYQKNIINALFSFFSCNNQLSELIV